MQQYSTKLSALLLAAGAAAVIVCLNLRQTSTLPANRFRLEIPSRTQVNDVQGGTLVITATTTEQKEVPVTVYQEDGRLSGVLTGQPLQATLTIYPRATNDRVKTDMTLTTESVTRTNNWFGAKQTETHFESSAGVAFEGKTFRLTAQPGLYPVGQPLIIGFVQDKAMMLVVGKAVAPSRQ
jgi:hypothetical protein